METTASPCPGKTTTRLRKKLLLYLAAALFVLVLAFALAISFTLFHHLKTEVDISVAHAAQVRSIAVSEWCRRARDLAWQVTSRSSIRQALAKYNDGVISLQELKSFSEPKLRDAMDLSEEIVGILRIDAKGREVASCGLGSHLPAHVGGVATFIQSGIGLSNPIPFENRALIVVSAPIVNPENQRLGTDLVILDTRRLQDLVAASGALGATGGIIVGCQSGNAASVLFPLRNPEGRHLSQADKPHIRSALMKAVSGHTGLENSADTLVAYAPVMESDWGLVVTQSDTELYFPVYRKLICIGALFLVVYFVALAGFWFTMKPLAGKLLLHADELEKEIREKTAVLEKEIREREQAQKALHRLNETLEQQVSERTALAEARAKQLQSQAAELIEVEERERRRIAQVLHDDLQQLLAAGRMQLEAASRTLPSDMSLAHVERLLTESIGKARRLSHELNPPVLRHSSLAAALEWLIRQMDDQFGLAVELTAAETVTVESTPLKVFLFRAVQELLFNIVKHAGVKTARVSLSSAKENLVIAVTDNGKGFDPGILDRPATMAGIGLFGLRERARSIGGNLMVESQPGRGSRFILTVPQIRTAGDESAAQEPAGGRPDSENGKGIPESSESE